MKNSVLTVGLYSVGWLFLLGCAKQADQCGNDLIVGFSTTASHPCNGTGTLQIKSPLGSLIQYQLDQSVFQSQPSFSGLKPGKHQLVVKNADGCFVSREFIVDTVKAGNLFVQVRQTLGFFCTPCHAGNNPQGGLNFTQACDILNHWDRIEARAIFGNPSPMPQAGLMPIAERQKLMDWIKANHAYDQ